MKHLGLIPEAIEKESRGSQTTFFSSLFLIRAGATGIFTPLIEPRDRMKKGHITARITDLFGNSMEDIRAPEDGFLVEAFIKRVVHRGDLLFNVARV